MRLPDRVMCYGVTGSGKSTLAQRLAELSGLPYHSVDDLTWLPGWVARTPEEQRAIFDEICQGERWLLDTAYGQWIDVVLPRVQLILALDYPRWLSLARLLRRTAARATDGQLVCNGNRETWRQALSRDSIVVWHFRSFARKRARIRRWLAEGRPVVRLTSPRELERWLQALER